VIINQFDADLNSLVRWMGANRKTLLVGNSSEPEKSGKAVEIKNHEK
jgi:hypothetical protein